MVIGTLIEGFSFYKAYKIIKKKNKETKIKGGKAKEVIRRTYPKRTYRSGD